MNCELVKEKLVDYIEKSLSNEEMLEIKNHLVKCNECMMELEELKDTIKIIEEKGENISIPVDFQDRVMEKMLKQNKPIKKKRRMRTGLIAAILSLVFVVTAFATDGLDFLKWWQNDSIKQLQAMNKLLDSGVGDRVNIVAEDKGIVITVEGVVADELNTMLLLKVEDKKDNTMYVPTFSEGIKVKGVFNTREGARSLNGVNNLYLKKGESPRVILHMDSIVDDETVIKLNINKLQTLMNKDEKDFKYIEGNWDFNIPVRKCTSKKVYDVNKEMNVDGNKILIKKIELYPTSTQLNYSYRRYNQKDNYDINFISLAIKYKGKTIDHNILGGIFSGLSDSNGLEGETIPLDTLYFDNPKKIKVVVTGYNKTTWGQHRYDIDLDNLPQTIDYKGNDITIEKVDIGENLTELIVKEEENRSYQNVEMNVRVEYNPHTWVNTEYLEYYITNSKGKRINEYDEDFSWYDSIYHITKRKLIVTTHEGIEDYLEEEGYSNRFVPVKFYINGEDENVKTNKSMTIKLSN